MQVRPDVVTFGGIAVIIAAILLGPQFSPDEFSWLRHSTSEQAGQGMPGAWIMRAGFYAYGFATLIASIADRRTRPWVRFALAVFGAGLVATAIWSNASILPHVSSDHAEDHLHSIASGVVGTAFAAACAARLFAPGGNRRDWLAWTGLVVSVVVPMAMAQFPDLRGALQRGMFGLSFLFVGREFAGPRLPGGNA